MPNCCNENFRRSYSSLCNVPMVDKYKFESVDFCIKVVRDENKLMNDKDSISNVRHFSVHTDISKTFRKKKKSKKNRMKRRSFFTFVSNWCHLFKKVNTRFNIGSFVFISIVERHGDFSFLQRENALNKKDDFHLVFLSCLLILSDK